MKLHRESLAALEAYLVDHGTDHTRDLLVAFVASIKRLRGIPIDRKLVSPILMQILPAVATGGDIGRAIKLAPFADAAEDAGCVRVAELLRSLPGAVAANAD